MTKLCKDCADALKDRLKTPMHLVHPEHGKFMVFDIYGMAVCPSCSAIWYRDHKGTVLLNDRKPPKRAMPVPRVCKRGVSFSRYSRNVPTHIALHQHDRSGGYQAVNSGLSVPSAG